MIDISELKNFDFFNGMSDAQLKSISEIAVLKEYQKDDCLEKEGMESNNMYIIKSGKIAFETILYGEKVARLGVALEGDYFGETSIIPPHKCSTTRVALENSVVLVIDGIRLRERCESDSELGYIVMKDITKMLITQMRRTREQLIHSHWG
ncbi:MAG: cyclic nucleotide-binding domain-containing protein [Spirochaetota bacterium]|nr:cyclic nucleotide-binding domain-containing protein [Spirochaetota bacterium]